MTTLRGHIIIKNVSVGARICGNCRFKRDAQEGKEGFYCILFNKGLYAVGDNNAKRCRLCLSAEEKYQNLSKRRESHIERNYDNFDN